MLDTETGEYTQADGLDGQRRDRHVGGRRALVYLSDREFNTDNLYLMDVAEGEEKIRRLTAFEGEDVEAFDVSHDGSTLVFVVWDRLYRMDLTTTARAR